ncbi:MAG: hypothetical protein ACLQIS_01650 [Bryobacteraceae bacterium]
MSPTATSRRETFTGMLLVSLLWPLGVRAQSPPPDLALRVAQRTTQARRARDQYTYRQTVVVEELSPAGARAGQYREIRDVVFSPLAERSEQVVGKPLQTLQRLQLTEEDFRDIREIQPFLFDSGQLWFYETRFKGEETMDGVDCYVLQVRPRQILAGQRLFDGLLWASKKDYSMVRTEGKAVPEMRSLKSENLFPHFTTLWGPVDGDLRFPLFTYADDTLDFRVGPQRVRLSIRYSNYQRFAAESTVKFGEAAAPSSGPGGERTP